jgi:hypothetical protein
MRMPLLLALVAAVPGLFAQAPPCPSAPIYTPCEIAFELNDAEAAAHPNPYLSVEIRGEFRSPRHRTFLMPAYWDGGRRMVIRITPIDPGDWNYRITSNLARLNNQLGIFTAAPADSPGFVRPANMHHWATTETNQPHLWMGDTCYRFGSIDRAAFDQILEARAKQKFTHMRGLVLGWDKELARAFPSADRPDDAYFRELDARVLAINRRGMVADLILGGDSNQLARRFPTPAERERYLRYIVSRYSPMNVTWQLVQEFEEYENARELMKELGLALKKLDPYDHPRSTHAQATSAPLLGDGWMNYAVYQSSNDTLGAIEHQLYPVPFVNAEFAYEDSGAGRALPHHTDADTFRHRLWNATMNGQYPTYGNTGTYGGKTIPVDAKYADSPGARAMTVWFDFISRTRHWELEPYFDVDGGRCVALEGVEYIVYVEKPGPVEIAVEKHGYDIAWFNPITGESLQQKDFKGERFTAEPPDKTHDWVLHISREGRKEGMLRSYKFASRDNPLMLQEVEQNSPKTPYELVEPSSDSLVAEKSVKFAVRLKRQTRATRNMMYLWTGEVAASDRGYRVLATGAEGTFQVPSTLASDYPAVMNLRVAAMNALGKVYFLDKVFTVTR